MCAMFQTNSFLGDVRHEYVVELKLFHSTLTINLNGVLIRRGGDGIIA